MKMLNHGKLSDQSLWWWCIGLSALIVILAICLFLVVIFGLISDRALSTIKSCLFLLAIIPFIISLLVNNHRAVQTKYQIDMSERKNRSDLYLAHYKYNTELLLQFNNKIQLQDHNGSFSIEVKHPIILYRKLYPQNNLLEGVEDITSVKAEEITVRFLCSLYEDYIVGISSNLCFSLRDLPVTFNDDDFICNIKDKNLKIKHSFMKLKLFLHHHGINLAYDDTNNNTPINHNDLLLSKNKWMYIIPSIFVFWLDVNRRLDSDLDESKIRYISRNLSSFLEKVARLE